ncbi:MAG: MBL fold metallo-hydrolase [Verrucomicrobia bacterium]|nr:MBL fold metallo-hydrolase [Verrucomicrobiota bacterium]
MSLTPKELYQRISKKNDFLLLDVRNPDDFQASRIEGRFTPETLNIPYYEFVEDEEKAVKRLPQHREIVALCNRGNSSGFVVELLKKYHIHALNIEGGIKAWGNLYVTHDIVQGQIIQIDRPARGCLSYILISQNEAIVIDPSRHIDIYREFLLEKKVRLTAVFDTHAHADHISGGFALAKAENVPYYLHPYDAIHPFDMLPGRLNPYEMLKDGFSFQIGQLTLTTVHVPGHTLGEVCFLVKDQHASYYLFSGDSLFLQSFGRPDLGGQGKAWAPLVFTSLFEIIKDKVPHTALVLPGHYSSAQESNESGAFARPVSEVYKQNKDLQVPKEAFVNYVLEHLPLMPPQYVQIKRINLHLADVSEQEASDLELGKNVCAISQL